MASPMLQASFALPSVQTCTVQQPTGIPLGVLTLLADQFYGTTSDLCADLEAQLLVLAGPGTWTVRVDPALGGRVTITTTAGNFDWTWNTAFVRDQLGYVFNVVNQASPWTTSLRHLGGFYPTQPLQSGVETAGYASTARRTQGTQSYGKRQDAVAVAGAHEQTRRLVVNLERTAGGDWGEFISYRTFLEYIADGRRFTLWPDYALGPYLWLHFRGPDELVYQRRFERDWLRFRVEWQVEDVSL